MTRTQKIILIVGALFFIGIARWACIARLDHDEGVLFGALLNFTESFEMKPLIEGAWGGRHVLSTGPAMTFPLAIFGAIFDVSIPLFRLYGLIGFSLLFFFATRLTEFKPVTALTSFTLFLLWVLCMPWGFETPSSLPLIAALFGEGFTFGFALMAILLSTRDDLRSRSLFWIFALLAVSTKAVGLILIAFPIARMMYEAARERDLKKIGWPGVLIATSVIALWQLWLVLTLGYPAYYSDWTEFFASLSRQGGYNSDTLTAFLIKFKTLRKSGVNPWVVIMMWIGAACMIRYASPFSRKVLITLLGSIGMYTFWFLFVSSRGWMRHLWPAHAVLGWMVALSLVSLFGKIKQKKIISIFGTAVLAVTAVWHGSMSDLVLVDRDRTWMAQREVAEEIGRKHPNSQLFVYDWRTVASVPFFLKKPIFNALEYPARVGDLLLCDDDSGCQPEIFAKICDMKKTGAHIGYCVLSD